MNLIVLGININGQPKIVDGYLIISEIYDWNPVYWGSFLLDGYLID